MVSDFLAFTSVCNLFIFCPLILNIEEWENGWVSGQQPRSIHHKSIENNYDLSKQDIVLLYNIFAVQEEPWTRGSRGKTPKGCSSGQFSQVCLGLHKKVCFEPKTHVDFEAMEYTNEGFQSLPPSYFMKPIMQSVGAARYSLLFCLTKNYLGERQLDTEHFGNWCSTISSEYHLWYQ